MEKEILNEIRQQLDELKAKVAELENKIASLEGEAAAPAEEPVVVAIDIDDIMNIDIMPEEPATFEAPAPEPEPVAEPEPQPEPEPEPEPAEEEDDEPSFMDLFGIAQESDAGTVNAKHRAQQKKAVLDVMENKEAWRTDLPGSAVKNVVSAISLNDRILFIRQLFEENPVLFQGTIAEINDMDDFNDAVNYLKENFPAWDFGSDTVYRFMMAIRRKLR